MYYYIAEPTTTPAERRRIEEIKLLLSQFGIAGEFAVASPARTVEEHLQVAFSKGFTTIVGIGSDALACKVAAMLMEYRHDRVAMGFIPFQKDDLYRLIGAPSLQEQVDCLRSRRLEAIDLLSLGTRQATIVPAVISSPKPMIFRLLYERCELKGRFTEIRLDPSGLIEIQAGDSARAWWQRLTKPVEPSLTRLEREEWQLATQTALPITVGQQIIGQTPITAQTHKKVLKLIVNRARITPDKLSQ